MMARPNYNKEKVLKALRDIPKSKYPLKSTKAYELSGVGMAYRTWARNIKALEDECRISTEWKHLGYAKGRESIFIVGVV